MYIFIKVISEENTVVGDSQATWVDALKWLLGRECGLILDYQLHLLLSLQIKSYLTAAV